MGLGYSLLAGLLVALLFLGFRRIARFKLWRNLGRWLKTKNDVTIIEFYERMQLILANKGLTRAPFQTPLEFASELNMPEAVNITEKYNRVRFGEKELTSEESKKIKNWLDQLDSSLK